MGKVCPSNNKNNAESLLSDDQKRPHVQENVNTHFDATVAYWDEVYRGEDLQEVIYQQRQMEVLSFIDAVGLQPDAHVLEIGCGAGHLTLQLAQRGLLVQAVDASAAMVESAARRVADAGLGDRVDLLQADAHALSFQTGRFELAVAVGVIPWLHAPNAAIMEMARVLAPGGQLIVTADNAARIVSFTDPRALLALTPLRRLYHLFHNRPGQAVSRLYFPRRVDRLLRHAGLRPLARKTVGFGPLSLLGRPLFSNRRAVAMNIRLQALADAGFPALRWAGWHYLVRAAKT